MSHVTRGEVHASRSSLLAVAVLCGSRLALAQPTPAPPANAEDAADQSASSLYEEALRAEALDKLIVAQQLAQRALDVSPNGRYSAAIQLLIDRLASKTLWEKPIPASETALGSQAAYVVSGGSSAQRREPSSGAPKGASGQGIAAIAIGGALIGVSLATASMSAVHDGSMPTHLWSGGIFAASLAVGALLLAGPNVSGNTYAGVAGAGLLAGAVAGGLLGGLTKLTAGDGSAGLVLGIQLVGEALLIEGSRIVGSNPINDSQVVGGTTLALTLVGFIGGEVLNQQAHWSGSRWGLVLLIATLGAALGGLLAATGSSGVSGALGAMAAGNAVGFAVGCLATSGMPPDVSRRTASQSSDQLHGRSLPAIPRAAFAWVF